MNRYRNIPIIRSTTSKQMYATSRYPEIPLSPDDIYVYATQGDRYDALALQYYTNSSLWWIIAAANPNIGLDSLILPEGAQIRIPSDYASVITQFNLINRL
jgi:phage tail protein X